ncbi:hypothetical protein CLV49_0052 [Labedella gwakjiensis]|uniref:Thioredoxin domain-containing protein n=1 Tax=Labedella gwakjiensis TaxID=390269 RepID=A0A2P8GR71_9MICO|nr:thioredoxin domain-containing protein [Labedella gwakjiensis]PSL36461.1 hypothetical protein CLV49_0052 [Labedella gwakjiensis]RUQ85615.1 thioredoxin domain-containing protein [Labedella gwakjiensis]
MPSRLADTVSPYLLAHADNPVDWWPWGEEAFAEARRRDVPVFISIGYATCHWCHVMARESFSDPEIAQLLGDAVVSIKVDREEHPGVDAAFLASASAFTPNLGWPLSVFATPDGEVFFAGTYFPPVDVQGHPAFRRVVAAVVDAWTHRRDQALATGAAVASAVRSSLPAVDGPAAPPGRSAIHDAVETLRAGEDREHGGFGGAPKFPVAPSLQFLLDAGADDLAARTLRRMATSDLRDPVEGGFFRYATNADWSVPHYERMLYDNALLLDAYTTAWTHDRSRAWAAETAAGIVRFLLETLRIPGGFASAQDSESTVRGERSEGGYYALDAAGRAQENPPALDRKVLTGWNGLAIAALARAGVAFGVDAWIEAAVDVSDTILDAHVRSDGSLVRASLDGRASTAVAALEDHGMLASALLATGFAADRPDLVMAGRSVLDAVLVEDGEFREPGGGDPVLVARGLALAGDPSEGAYPSGRSACAEAAFDLHLLTGERRYREAAERAASAVAALASASPVSFGSSLRLAGRLADETVQLVVVRPDGVDRRADPMSQPTVVGGRPALSVAVSVSASTARELAEGGFDLFAAREAVGGASTAYVCRDFVCRLPITDPQRLEAALADGDSLDHA